ncbi:unnamed protein product [Echinostoma caproni]|uniref:Pecanex-like protein n=1 Tax=Echinostoma caproni TaxID=27848 RepID=A0A183A8Y0_9TREM|nr:unnamed protein product [Echinostoma caproni]
MGLKSLPNDWPKLTDFSLERISFLNRLSSSASVICRRPVQEQDTAHPTAVEQPLDFLFTDPSDTSEETSKEVRYALLQTLSSDIHAGVVGPDSTEPLDPLDRSTHSATESGVAPPVRDPSTTELLAMAAVTLAKSFEHDGLDRVCHDKNVPCQRRAGRLRGKCATHANELADSTDAGSGLGADNSMGTSLATMTTTTMNPSLPSQDHALGSAVPATMDRVQYSLPPYLPSHRISLLGDAPPGQSVPHWLTLHTSVERERVRDCWSGFRCALGKPYSSLATTDNLNPATDSNVAAVTSEQLSVTKSHRSLYCCFSSAVAEEEDEQGLAPQERRNKFTSVAAQQLIPFHCLLLGLTALIPLLLVIGLIHLILVSK